MVPNALRTGDQGILDSIWDGPMDSIMTGEDLRIFLHEISIGIWGANHPVAPTCGSKTLFYISDIGVTGLSRAFRSLKIDERGTVMRRLVRQYAIRSIGKAWQQGGRVVLEAVFDFRER